MAARAGTRDRLLDAADELFADRGFAATPVDAVLARAGVAPATLYAHFGGKDALLAATLERRLARWETTWDDAVAAAPDDRARLLSVFDALAAFRARPAASRWCAFLGAAADTTTAGGPADAALAGDTELLRTRLTALARPLAGDAADELAAHLLVVVTGCLAMRLRDPGTDHVARARTTAGLVVDHWTAGPPRPVGPAATG